MPAGALTACLDAPSCHGYPPVQLPACKASAFVDIEKDYQPELGTLPSALPGAFRRPRDSHVEFLFDGRWAHAPLDHTSFNYQNGTMGTTGMGQQPGMQPGMGQPGMHPGMQQGMQPGMYSGVGQQGTQSGMPTGMQPGMGQPGMQPMGQPAMQPHMGQPGMGNPGMGQQNYMGNPAMGPGAGGGVMHPQMQQQPGGPQGGHQGQGFDGMQGEGGENNEGQGEDINEPVDSGNENGTAQGIGRGKLNGLVFAALAIPTALLVLGGGAYYALKPPVHQKNLGGDDLEVLTDSDVEGGKSSKSSRSS